MFPFALFLLVDHLPSYLLITLFAILAGARVWTLANLSDKQRLWTTALIVLFSLGAALAAKADPNLSWLRSYPVLISLSLAIWFTLTLFQDEPATAKLARLGGMEVPPQRLGYLRVLTGIWVVFLLLNAGISAYTAVASSTGAWALYNGVISYLLMGLLFSGEYLFRQVLIRREQTANESS